MTVDYRRLVFRICKTKQELHDWILFFLDIDLPDAIVDPDSNSSPMDMVWECYSKMLAGDDENFMRVLYYASRDSFKTLAASIIEVLSVLHLERDVAHMAAIQDQSAKAQQYVKRAFRRPYIRDFVEGDNERVTKLVRFYNPITGHSLSRKEFEQLRESDQSQHEEVARVLNMYEEKEGYIKIVICTIRGANSEHVPTFVIDEVDVVQSPQAYEEAQNIPSGRKGKYPLTILTSTRKYAFGLVQKEIDNAQKSGLQIRHWNIIDVTQRCPESRHKPHEPRVRLWVSDQDLVSLDDARYAALSVKEKEKYVPYNDSFAGCAKCKLHPACKGRLATHQTSKSVLLKPIQEVINKCGATSVEMVQAQLLCRKPSSVGLIYSRIDLMRHVLSPHRAYQKIFGEAPGEDAKDYSKAALIEAIREREVVWKAAIDWGDTHNFVYVLGFRDGDRMFITHCLSAKGLDPDQQIIFCEPMLKFKADTYADTADPKSTRYFEKHGHRMKKWKKRSVIEGITTVRTKLNPALKDEPELFFILDQESDDGISLLVDRLRQYSWKLGADGLPTNIPNDMDDDECDALRYLIDNEFGKQASATLVATDEAVPPPQNGLYDPKTWMKQVIAERVGDSTGYYGSQNPPDDENPVKTDGRTIFYDFS